MCGLAVVIDLAEDHGEAPRVAATTTLGEEMLDRIRHRGPDGSGRKLIGRAWLGHARLSIVDVGGGAQPLPDGEHHSPPTDDTWLVANGEIYNHQALRAELGGPFHTTSDSEVIARVVDRLGITGIRSMRGMFAFCLARSDSSVLVARDPLGVKPLYWARHDSRLLVASEINAFPPAARSEIEEFPPGFAWSVDGGLQPFADLPAQLRAEAVQPFITRGEAVTAIREALITAVAERMMSDVPVGVFLSGGLDSSLIAAIMTRLAPPGTTVRSFSAGTVGSADLVAARQVAEYLGLEHHERCYDEPEVEAVIGDVVRSIESFEPSLVRSAVPNFLLSELTGRTTKVVLTGEGADELFAGYHHLRELDEAALRDALIEGVEVLHNLNLQRCDRVTMAHGVEARVPFLSRDVLEVALRIPVRWKMLGEDGQAHAQEKALLREAFEGWLPEEILWRRKEQFGDGSGTADVMTLLAQRLTADVGDGWRSERFAGLPPARTPEELVYQRIFAAHLGGVDAMRLLGRFAHA